MDRARDWKAFQIDYDAVVAASEETRCYRLSDQTVAILLSQIAYAHWPTRWDSNAPLTDLQKAQIRAMAALAESSLMAAELCCEDQTMDVRQNEENPCILEKTTDGIIWTAFADLSLCVPDLRYDPARGIVEISTDGGTTYDPIPTGPYVPPDPAVPTFDPPARTEDTSEERICVAAANAAYVLRRTYEDVAARMIDEIVDQIDLAETIYSIVSSFLPPWLTSLVNAPVLAALILLQEAYVLYPFTDEAEEEVKCRLIECATDTGSVVTLNYACVMSVFAEYGFGNFPEIDLLQPILNALGANALNMAASGGYITDADCECLEDCQLNDHAAGFSTRVYKCGTGVYSGGCFRVGGQWSSEEGGVYKTTFAEDGFGIQQMNIVVDLLAECTINTLRVSLKNSGAPAWHDHVVTVAYKGADNTTRDTYDSGSGQSWPSWTQVTIPNVVNDVRYILISVYDWNNGTNQAIVLMDEIRVNMD